MCRRVCGIPAQESIPAETVAGGFFRESACPRPQARTGVGLSPDSRRGTRNVWWRLGPRRLDGFAQVTRRRRQKVEFPVAHPVLLDERASDADRCGAGGNVVSNVHEHADGSEVGIDVVVVLKSISLNAVYNLDEVA